MRNHSVYAVLAGLASASIVLGLLAGCGRGAKTVSVSGTVILDDKPVEGVTVTFLTVQHAAAGKTDAKGRYKIQGGAQPGKNSVLFSKIVGGMSPDDPALAATGADPARFVKPKGEEMPERYCNPMKPGETFDVPERGTSSADFKLKSK